MKMFLILTISLLSFHMVSAQLTPFKDKETQLYGYKSPTGAIIVAPQYSMANAFRNGMAAVNKGAVVKNVTANGGKWGFLDSAGHVAIPLIYDYVQDFRGDSARVVKGRKKYLIDKTGKVIDEIRRYEIIRHPDPIDWKAKQ
ncbi:MAG: hypothetical protein DI598_08220 [Pseudopedobacter saltans]|uniref:WG repeat-containing protein n=1 Tax=Pseudopedobacter saltans TaxID=151895 RepID=A0A2W5F3E3_9SPHI|nr:MAG: hypothetical protein DI598_08220 [Pseudopedobacter saltans]